MSTPTVFVVKNQAGLFLNKQQEWIEGGDRQTLYRTTHRDEAVNTVFEVSSKDIYLRAEVLACPVDSKGQPLPQGADLLAQAEQSTQDAAANQEETSDDAAHDVLATPETSNATDEPIDSAIDESDAPETMAASVETTNISA